MGSRSALKNWLDDLLDRKEYRRYGEREHRKTRLLSQFTAILGMIAGAVYLIVCLYFANWEVWYTFIPFFIADTGFFVLFLVTSSNLWLKRFHNPKGVECTPDFSVDIFIPVCKEPVEIVENTIRAAVNIRYDNKKIFILDDGNDDTLRDVSCKYPVTYLRRSTSAFRKAGNLNFAFKQTSGDLILALDADQEAEPEIIERISGYFTIPRIGFVQTPQRFILPENDPWGNADNVFYKAIQTAKDSDNSAISCGSGVMYRRKALEDIGGFSQWNLVEDLHTSMLLHDKGWHSVYHNIPMTRGTAPCEVVSQMKQRWHWAVDSMRIIFWDSPLLRKGLKWPQRLQYFHFGYYYIVVGLFLPISIFFIPQWALLSHKFILTIPPELYFLARIPYLILETIANKLLSERVISFRTNQAQVSLFSVYFNAIFVALGHKKSVPVYTVTRKRPEGDPFLVRLRKCLPHLMVISITAYAIAHGLTRASEDLWFFGVNTFFASLAILYLWKFVILSLWPKLIIK